jgi:hypothetical protein
MIAKDKRWSLTTLSWLHTDQELEQEFNLLLMKVDMFWELRFSWLLNRLWVQEDPRQCFAQLRELYESLWHIQSSVISSLNIFYTSKHLIKDSEIAECAIIFSPIVSNSTTKHDGIIILETLFMQWWISKNLIEKIMYAIITPR